MDYARAREDSRCNCFSPGSRVFDSLYTLPKKSIPIDALG